MIECDYILVVKGDRITHQGTYEELKAQNVNFSALVSDDRAIMDDSGKTLEKSTLLLYTKFAELILTRKQKSE